MLSHTLKALLGVQISHHHPSPLMWCHGEMAEQSYTAVLSAVTSNHLSSHQQTKDGRATDSCFALIGDHQCGKSTDDWLLLYPPQVKHFWSQQKQLEAISQCMTVRSAWTCKMGMVYCTHYFCIPYGRHCFWMISPFCISLYSIHKDTLTGIYWFAVALYYMLGAQVIWMTTLVISCNPGRSRVLTICSPANELQLVKYKYCPGYPGKYEWCLEQYRIYCLLLLLLCSACLGCEYTVTVINIGHVLLQIVCMFH